VALASPNTGGLLSSSLSLQHVELVGLCWCLVLATGFAPGLMVSAWSPRFAVVLFTLPVCACLLVRAVRQRDIAGCCAAAALGWVLLAAFTQPSTALRILGMNSVEASGIVMVAAIGCWLV